MTKDLTKEALFISLHLDLKYFLVPPPFASGVAIMPLEIVAPWLHITEWDVLPEKLVLAVQGATGDRQRAEVLIKRTFSRRSGRYGGSDKDKARRLEAFTALCGCQRHGEAITFLQNYYRGLGAQSAVDPEIEEMAVKRMACMCRKPESTAVCD